jgi:branched-subunit amino acid ABC-type transport system permease component
MARGEHPQRTPFYGALLLMGAYLSCWLASSIHTLWLAIAIYVAAAIVAAIGFIMTFRDYSS